MTTRAQVTKAAMDQTAALVAAMGLPQAWQAIAAAAENQIPTASKEPLLRSIASAQLSQAAATVKADGLTPEVIDLLRQLLELMAGQPAAAQPAEPAPAPAPGMPMEAAVKAQPPSDSEIREAVQAAVHEKFPAADDEPCRGPWVVEVFSADSTAIYESKGSLFQIGYSYDPAAGTASLTGSPTEVRRTYEPIGAAPAPAATDVAASAKADEATKGLPSPQTDSLSLGQQAKDPPMSREQRKADAEKAGLPAPEDASNLRTPETDTDFRREADAFKADEAEKSLPAPQKDSMRLGEQVKDKPLSTPQRKNAGRPWWEADDIAPRDPPKPKRYMVPSY